MEKEIVGCMMANLYGEHFCDFFLCNFNFIDFLSFRYWMNYIASAFVTVGVLFDAGVWFYVKDLKIFDEKTKTKEIEIVALDKKQQENDEKTLTLSVNEKNEKKIVNYD